MGTISGTIPHLVSGVSQQPAPNRIRTAAAAVENAYLSVVSGNQRRQPFQHVAVLNTSMTVDTDAAVWTIRRDDLSKFAVVFTDGDLEVYDLSNGSKNTVTFTGTKDYLASSNPKRDFRVAAVGDTVFVLNRSVTAAGAATTETRDNPAETASVFIKRAVASTTYAIYVNGVLAGSFSTSDNTTAGTALEGTADIAEELATDLIANGYTDAVAVGPTVTFGITDGDELATLDQFGGLAMRAYTDTIQSFDELPPEESAGRIVRIKADFDDTGDDFYVVYQDGVWVETVGYDQGFAFNGETMPMALVRTGASTWEWDVVEWETRPVGDSDTNANPTFVGNTINDIRIHKGRMVLLSDSNMVMSEVGVLENFWRTSTTQLLDADRIDVAANTAEVHTLNHVLAFEDRLFAMSDTAVFEATGGESVLSPATIEMGVVFAYENSADTRPAQAGPAVFFGADGASASKVYEMLVDTDLDVTNIDEITEHVPDYITPDITKMTASPSEKILVATSSGSTDTLWVYKWFTKRREKHQSAWSKWTLTGATILGASFIESDLFVIATISGALHLMRMEVADRPFTQSNRSILLDNRTPSTDCTLTYNSGTDTTTVELPWGFSGELEFWSNTDPFGLQLTGSKTADDEYELDGDVTSTDFSAGIPYTWSVELSTQYVREQRGSGEIVIQDGLLQLGQLLIQYQGTSYFEVEIASTNRSARTLTFNGRILSDPGNEWDDTPLATGTFTALVMSRNTDVTITVSSPEPLPASIGSIEWNGGFYPKARRRF